MRKSTLTGILLLYMLCLYGQNTKQLESHNKINQLCDKTSEVKITGQLVNFDPLKDSGLILRYTISTPTFRRQIAGAFEIENDGSFEMGLQCFPYTEIWIALGDLYYGKLMVNDGIHLQFDLEVLKNQPVYHLGPGVAMQGKDAEISLFVNGYEDFKVESKKELQEEKLALILSQDLDKNDKVEEIRKINKKLASLEKKYVKKNGKALEWVLSNDRMASMYADILTVHWGKGMNQDLFAECTSFNPILTSNATVQYYDFLGFFLGVPNRLETKMITEKTLHNHLNEAYSSADLDIFLREFNKKTDFRRYDEDIYTVGKEYFLDPYKKELFRAKTAFHIKKMAQLPKNKSDYVMLVSQPQSLQERSVYLSEVNAAKFSNWAKHIGDEDMTRDLEWMDQINSEITERKASATVLAPLPDLENAFLSATEDIYALISGIRKRYENQPIIIDLWVPWMDRCKSDLINSKSLQLAIDTMSVKMVYLCSGIDVQREYWMESILDFPWEGEHIFLSEKLSADIMELLDLRTFPSYLFIDSTGYFDPYVIQNLDDFNLEDMRKEVREQAGI
ncbi:hypothetical protein [Portibacter marinus]|uniref:hypothetical protein n=1 Tax=Portibacter marinus TaxID=2898660 RepID=UPI001F3BABF7|nr:hypothetical protein [Portibacter marinus]